MRHDTIRDKYETMMMYKMGKTRPVYHKNGSSHCLKRSIYEKCRRVTVLHFILILALLSILSVLFTLYQYYKHSFMYFSQKRSLAVLPEITKGFYSAIVQHPTYDELVNEMYTYPTNPLPTKRIFATYLPFFTIEQQYLNEVFSFVESWRYIFGVPERINDIHPDYSFIKEIPEKVKEGNQIVINDVLIIAQVETPRYAFPRICSEIKFTDGSAQAELDISRRVETRESKCFLYKAIFRHE